MTASRASGRYAPFSPAGLLSPSAKIASFPRCYGTEFENEVPGSGAEINYNITVLQGQCLNYVSGALPYVSPTFYLIQCVESR